MHHQKDSKCFQYAITVALNHEDIGKHSERITKIKLFINKCTWEGIHFPSEKDGRKKIEKNNVTIVLNVFYVKKTKYTLLMFQNIIGIVKSKLFF